MQQISGGLFCLRTEYNSEDARRWKKNPDGGIDTEEDEHGEEDVAKNGDEVELKKGRQGNCWKGNKKRKKWIKRWKREFIRC